MSSRYIKYGVVFLWMGTVHYVSAQETSPAEQILQQQLQQERQTARESELTPVAPSVRFEADSGVASSSDYPIEAHCFVIQQIILEEQQTLPQAVPLNAVKQQAEGHCLGGVGINQLMSNLQNLIIDRISR